MQVQGTCPKSGGYKHGWPSEHFLGKLAAREAYLLQRSSKAALLTALIDGICSDTAVD